MADFESNDWWQGTKNLDTVYAQSMSVVDRLAFEHGGNREATHHVLTEGFENPELLSALPEIDDRELLSLQEELPALAAQIAAGTRMLLQRAALSETEYIRAVNAVMWLSFVRKYCLLLQMRQEPPEEFLLDPDYLASSQREQGDFASSQLLLRAAINMMDFTDLSRENLIMSAIREGEKGKTVDFDKGLRAPLMREFRHLAALLPQSSRPQSIELPFTGHREQILDDDDLEAIYEGVENKEATLSDICATIDDTVGAIDLLFDQKKHMVDDGENIPDTDFAQLQLKLLQCQCELLAEHYGKPEIKEIDEGHPLYDIPPNYRADFVHLQQMEGRRFTKDVMRKYIRIVDDYKQSLNAGTVPEEVISAVAAAKMIALRTEFTTKQRSHKLRDYDKERRRKKQSQDSKKANRKKRK
ncbi:hypothetical protein COU78_02450 [Candidatus Peregrinibacteria bacterium CG10_big_fil_rev_8_21_14_0_10_49_24]|nr:MAG: hypothetical protein COV83_02430 [Candidatus Peregrinibacteria bacterium CG11_big_fil_rev_8_21_14_0_20_49_14]PIR50998.1 MAG: hypothetical protein COU78_02450 [Candidatus Peregrinibacteria bacterium CG10_big_fil_rev_8_21_14_0_10_49_24]PJA67551.1 MAG: hypothetical protein CO157_03930 [Candidatus Peregrinibacteria bacterium CG_4_9_14_3_um_filter_49_12]